LENNDDHSSLSCDHFTSECCVLSLKFFTNTEGGSLKLVDSSHRRNNANILLGDYDELMMRFLNGQARNSESETLLF
jgi:hypothetical protein